MRSIFLFTVLIFSQLITFEAISATIKIDDSLVQKNLTTKKFEKILFLTDTGKKYFKQDNYQKSLEFLIQAKNMNPYDSLHLAPYYNAFSALFKKIGAYDAAITYLKKVVNSDNDNLDKYYSYSDIGELFSMIDKSDSALFYYQKQYVQAKKYMSDFIAEASALNNQGLALMKLQRFTEANSIFQKALTIVETNSNNTSKNFSTENKFKFAILENSARCYYEFKDYFKVIEILEYSKQNLGEKDIDENNRILIMAYLKTGDKVKAERLLNLLTANGTKLTLLQQKKLLEIKLDYLLELDLIELIKAEFLVLNKINELIKIEENIKNNQMSNLLTQFLENEALLNAQQEKVKKLLIEKELSIQKQQNSVYRSVTILLVLFSILGIYLSYLYSKNNKKASQLQKDRLILQSQEQAYKIKVQETNIVDMALGLNKNLEYEQNIVHSLTQITEANPGNIHSEIKSLLAEIKQKRFIDKDAELIFNEAKTLLEPFRLQLNINHPTLTKSEIQLCYYVRLNLTNKEIAVLKNVTTNSVKIFKNRLRQKLSFEGERTLSEYLNSF